MDGDEIGRPKSQVSLQLSGRGWSRRKAGRTITERHQPPAFSISGASVNALTIERISDVIKKLKGLEGQLKTIERVANHGFSPHRAREELKRVEDFFRRAFANPPILTELKNKTPELRWIERQIRNMIRPPTEAQKRTAKEQVDGTLFRSEFQSLPIAHLVHLREKVIPKLSIGDDQRLTTRYSVANLKGDIIFAETRKKGKADEVGKRRIRRVFKVVDRMLAPYQELLAQRTGNKEWWPTTYQLSQSGWVGLEGTIHEFDRIRCSLEVEADLEEPDQKSNRQRQPSGPRAADNSTRRFATALSFPGERRRFVQQVAACLAMQLGQDRVLYDKYHEAEFARPDLDTHLQRLYHDESELVVVFLCADYQQKEWCGLEWRAIRDLMKGPRKSDIMLVRFDDTTIPGLFSIDGCLLIGNRPPEEIGDLILQRLGK